MHFNSFWFVFVFLPATLTGYLILRRTRFANLFMLVMSLYFYAVGAIWYLIPLFITALLDFLIGQKIEYTADRSVQRRLLAVSMVANLALLSTFKYSEWLLGHPLSIIGITLALPPAISFYTFQSMSYTIDIYRREFKPYRNVVDYLSFVAFFPHLVAGPIMRARDLLPQLARRRPLPSAATVSAALFMILFGLFQKAVLADNFGGLVEVIQRLAAGHQVPPGLGLIFAYAFAFQIYCDFAAYSTIARGVARLFGVDLMRNFLTPYFSSNPSEFWTRWHISLSQWLRDYLYIPLGGNRGGTVNTLRNLMITMVLGGLWHGAGVFFIVWGAYHGFLLILYRVAPIDDLLKRYFGWLGKALSIVLFFHLICLGWIFFRATPDQFWPLVSSILALPDAIGTVATAYAPYLTNAATFSEAVAVIRSGIWAFVSANWALSVYAWGLFLFGVPLAIADCLGWYRNCEFPDLFDRMPWLVRSVVILALIYGIVFFARREANEFIYFAF